MNRLMLTDEQWERVARRIDARDCDRTLCEHPISHLT